MAASSRLWVLPEHIANQLQQHIDGRFAAILQPLFFAYPELPLTVQKSWRSKDSTTVLRVKEITGDRVMVTSTALNKDTSLTSVEISETCTLDKNTGNILSATHTYRTYPQTAEGKSVPSCVNTTIKLLDRRPAVKPFNQELFRKRMYMSFRSDSLKTGVEYDAAKVHRFLLANDATSGQDSAYIMSKLFLFQQSGDYRQYDKQLQKMPVWMLRPSPTNIHNKLQDVYGKDPDSALSTIVEYTAASFPLKKHN